MLKFSSIFVLIIFGISCAKTTEQKIESAKNEAKYWLSEGKCTKARSVLDDVGEQGDDAVYISLYAATYACQAGYSELDFIANLGSLNANSLIGSLASFSSSDPADFNHTKFNYLMSAINYILDSAGSTPSTVSREDEFGQVKGTDLSLQALYMIMYGMGKFFAYYGNAANGLKGQGAAGNVCIGNYIADADIDEYLDNDNIPAGTGPINGCDSGNDGHADLKAPVDTALIATRLCHGIVLFNNLFDILSNVTLSSNDSLGDLGSVSTAVSALFTTAEGAEDLAAGMGVGDGAAVETLKSITSQSVCEEQLALHHQMYYVILFETNFSDT